MSIEAAWVVKLLWMILILAMFTKTFLSFEKSQSDISENDLRPLAYLTFPARIINQIS